MDSSEALADSKVDRDAPSSELSPGLDEVERTGRDAPSSELSPEEGLDEVEGTGGDAPSELSPGNGVKRTGGDAPSSELSPERIDERTGDDTPSSELSPKRIDERTSAFSSQLSLVSIDSGVGLAPSPGSEELSSTTTKKGHVQSGLISTVTVGSVKYFEVKESTNDIIIHDISVSEKDQITIKVFKSQKGELLLQFLPHQLTLSGVLRATALHHATRHHANIYYNDGVSEEFLLAGTMESERAQHFGPLTILSVDEKEFSFELTSLCYLCYTSSGGKFPFTLLLMGYEFSKGIQCIFVLTCNHEKSIKKSKAQQAANGAVFIQQWQLMCPPSGHITLELELHPRYIWSDKVIEFPSDYLSYVAESPECTGGRVRAFIGDLKPNAAIQPIDEIRINCRCHDVGADEPLWCDRWIPIWNHGTVPKDDVPADVDGMDWD